jgi:drug/metabolite transporter superfamily protein YnfA
MDYGELTRADLLWAAAALLVALAGFSIWAERRRTKRADLDRPGLVPWHAVQIFALFLAIAAAALAAKGG